MVKIVVNMGVSASLEKNAVEDAAKDLGLITGHQAGHKQVAPQHRQLQAPPGPAHRMPRHTAQGRDV
jgi:hypothetical protein